MSEYGFFLTRIFQYKNRILVSVFTGKYWSEETVSWDILHSVDVTIFISLMRMDHLEAYLHLIFLGQ